VPGVANDHVAWWPSGGRARLESSCDGVAAQAARQCRTAVLRRLRLPNRRLGGGSVTAGTTAASRRRRATNGRGDANSPRKEGTAVSQATNSTARRAATCAGKWGEVSGEMRPAVARGRARRHRGDDDDTAHLARRGQAASGMAAVSFGQRRVPTAAPAPPLPALSALTRGRRTWPGGMASTHATDRAAQPINTQRVAG
jgi:hypothetical protein